MTQQSARMIYISLSLSLFVWIEDQLDPIICKDDLHLSLSLSLFVWIEDQLDPIIRKHDLHLSLSLYLCGLRIDLTQQSARMIYISLSLSLYLCGLRIDLTQQSARMIYISLSLSLYLCGLRIDLTQQSARMIYISLSLSLSLFVWIEDQLDPIIRNHDLHLSSFIQCGSSFRSSLTVNGPHTLQHTITMWACRSQRFGSYYPIKGPASVSDKAQFPDPKPLVLPFIPSIL